MVNLLVGLISSILILILFSFLERKRVSHIGKTKYLFILIVTFSAYISDATNDLFIWTLWLLMFYTVLDDLKTQTIFTPIYLVVITCLFFKGHTIEEFIYAVILFVIFLLFSKKTKETFFSIGDCFVIFALVFWMGKLATVALLLAAILAGAILPIISMSSKGKKEYYPFSVFLVISSIIVLSNWHVGMIIIVGFIMNFIMLCLKLCSFLKRKRESEKL
ncbi:MULTISPECIES: hypothetical protein [Bacillus cereus group]|uniref:Prepilin type IV endopeptidase peptidase domain-containing protein n=1 Tax=Bacillus thuringiensis TaxID=1428 RepID=A0A9X6WGU1_BACTU|nr:MULTISPECIES: hypothetical protein [Bacillus cereus group]MDA1674788.1 hypothetical protein [Bacillus cereus group sp. TH152-1LC]PFJ29157.1 hypothetical protein COJ15_32095 [Bacillus thuringiensis]